MSMNGLLLQVSPELGDRLRADPDQIDALVLRHSLGAFGRLDDAMADSALADSLPGCLGLLYRLIPRSRRGSRLSSSEPSASAWSATPGVPLPVHTAEELKRLAIEAGIDEEDLPDDEEFEEMAALRAAGLRPGIDDGPEGPLPGPDPGEGRLLSVHKDWHALHWLLNGSAEHVGPGAGGAILGGHELGDDLGYGPARLLTPTEVAEIAKELATLGAQRMLARFDLRAMAAADVYSFDDEDADRSPEGLRAHVEALVRFYEEAASNGRAVVLWLA